MLISVALMALFINTDTEAVWAGAPFARPGVALWGELEPMKKVETRT
jgi:hypothetical protein